MIVLPPETPFALEMAVALKGIRPPSTTISSVLKSFLRKTFPELRFEVNRFQLQNGWIFTVDNTKLSILLILELFN